MPASRDDILRFLQDLGVDKTRHSGRSLLDHLVSTAAIVERWGASEHAVNAALLHSIYGTEFFTIKTLTAADRPVVVEKIGSYAEKLVWLFCSVERRGFFEALLHGEPYHVLSAGEETTLTRTELRDLLLILWANLIDHPGAKPARDRVVLTAPLLPEHVVHELLALVDPAPPPVDPAPPPVDPAPPPVDPVLPVPAPASTAEPASSVVATFLCREDASELFARDAAGVPAWLRQPFLAHGPVERLGGLCDFTLEEVWAMDRTFTKAFFRNGDAAHGSVSIQPGEEQEHYDAGRTIYLHSVHHPTIDAWLDAVSEELGLLREATRVSVFASRKGLGLKPHFDPNDNIVCQARGHKRWRYSLHDAVAYPTTGQTMGARLSRVSALETGGAVPSVMRDPITVDMVPGSVLIMPRGIWHETETVADEHGEESLHFNIQTGVVTWKDVLDFVLSRSPALHAEVFRAPMTCGAASGAVFGDALAVRLRVFTHAVSTAAQAGRINLDTPEFRDFVARRRSAY